MAYNSTSDESNDKKKLDLQRRLMSEKEILRRMEMHLSKLLFDERTIKKEDDFVSAGVSEIEKKIAKLEDELRILETNAEANKKVTRRLEDELKNLRSKDSEVQRKESSNEDETSRVKNDIARTSEEIKKIENELKKM